jgi:hypothetical protein
MIPLLLGERLSKSSYAMEELVAELGSAFSDLLIKHKVKFSERVVSTLEELPLRIETEIARLAPAS